MDDLARKQNVRRIVATFVLVLSGACSQNEAPDDGTSAAPAVVRLKTAPQALEGAHVPTLDPHTLNDAEIRKLIGNRPHCSFRYTSTGKPVAVVGLDPDGKPAVGAVKFNGSLVALSPDPGPVPDSAAGFVLVADPVRLHIRPDTKAVVPAAPGERLVEAEMAFEVGQQLKVGYAGYLECRGAPAAPAGLAAQ